MNINDDIQKMMDHVDQASRLMNDPVFMKKLKRYSRSTHDVMMPFLSATAALIAFGMIFHSNVLIFAALLSMFSGFGTSIWFVVQQHRLNKKAQDDFCVKDKLFPELLINDMQPAPLQSRVVVTQRAAHVVNDDVAAQLAQMAKRDDVPMGWWSMVDGVVLEQIERNKQEERRRYNEQHNNDQVLLEKLDRIASKEMIVIEPKPEVDPDQLHSTKTNQHMNI